MAERLYNKNGKVPAGRKIDGTRKKKTGPKPYKLDEEGIRKLAEIGATYKEIAYLFDVSVELLEHKYKHIIDAGKAEGRIAIRAAQMEAARDGNAAVLIHLGKTVLKQREKDEEEKVDASLQVPTGYEIVVRKGRKASLQEEDTDGNSSEEDS